MKIYEIDKEENEYLIKRDAVILYSKKINSWFYEEKISKINLKLNENELILDISWFDYLMKGEHFWVVVSKLIKDSMFYIPPTPKFPPLNDGFFCNIKSPEYKLQDKNIVEKVNISFDDFQNMMEIYLGQKNEF